MAQHFGVYFAAGLEVLKDVVDDRVIGRDIVLDLVEEQEFFAGVDLLANRGDLVLDLRLGLGGLVSAQGSNDRHKLTAHVAR